MSDGAAAPSSLFGFGFGYCAQALAAPLEQDGWRIAGTTRDGKSISGFKKTGIEVFPFDRAHPLKDAAGLLSGFSHLLVSIAPDAEGDPVLSSHREEISHCVRNGTLRWIGYLSTTGVYGDHQGAWVDEGTPTAPTSERSLYRVAAEEAWLGLAEETGVVVNIFRLAGIYGPGRNQVASVRSGSAHRIHKPDQVFSRVHVDDIAGVLRAAMARSRPDAIYNVCDDEAAPPDEVVAFAAKLAGVAPPPLVQFAEAEMSPIARTFYADNKRVSNRFMKDDLGYELKYPTYRDGLRALAGPEDEPSRI